MDSLYTVIREIVDFPEIYIGKKSLERLYAFIGGYLHHNTTIDASCLEGFNEYVAEKYRIKTSHNWASIIDFFSNNEDAAFDTFIELFEAFNAECKP